MISDFSISFAVLSSMGCCTFCCKTVSYDSRNILCTCTTFSLLCSTMYEGADLNTLTDIKEADSLSVR